MADAIDNAIDDAQQVRDLMADKRKFAERLETDPEFKAKYLEEQEKHLNQKKVDALLEKLAMLKQPEETDQSVDVPEPPIAEDIPFSELSRMPPPNTGGITIMHVDKLVIKNYYK